MVFNSVNKMRTYLVSIRLGYTSVFFYSKFLKHAIDMKNESFNFFTIRYERNNFKC